MPAYVYTCAKCGHDVENVHSIHDTKSPSDRRPECVMPGCDGTMYYNWRKTHATGRRQGDIWTNFTSIAMGVLADQKQEAEAELAAAGVPTEFRIEGETALPVITSLSHHRRVTKALGFHDRDSFN